MFGGCDCCTCGIGRCCGATFSVHWTFWFNLIVQLIFAIIQYASSWKYILLILVVWGPACLLALVFHEWGHISATKCQRGAYSYSVLWPLGGFNDCTVHNGTCAQQLFIAICGPFMHLPLMFLWLIVLSVSSDGGVSYYSSGFDINTFDDGGAGEWFSQLAKRSLDVNIMIFAINMLLPAYPMDAASAVAAICGHFGLSIESTGWVLLVIGTILGAIGVVVGILFLIAGTGPGVFLLLMGLYVLYESWQLYGQIKAGSLAHHPIFRHDCYHKQRTNLSRSAPPPRTSQTPPGSPRRATSSKPSVSSPRPVSAQPPASSAGGSKKTPKKPKKNSTKKIPGAASSGDIETGKKPLPRRDSSRKKAPAGSATGDIETGNANGLKASKPKKKAPAKKQTPDA